MATTAHKTGSLDLDTFTRIAQGAGSMSVEEGAWARVRDSFAYLSQVAAKQVVYGINTGFGPMAQHAVSPADAQALQYNLVRSHASGTGGDLPDEAVRAMMLVRATTFLQGRSGVSEAVVRQLLAYLEHGICPRVPVLGGVGASGDLVQQAHLGLGLIGEGRGTHHGKPGSMADILAAAGLRPVELRLRDGLAMLNGTAAMTGIGLLNIGRAHTLYDTSIGLSALITEALGTWTDHLGEPLNGAKRHAGQRETARRMRAALEGSQLVRDRMEHLAPGSTSANGTYTHMVQEYYSIRCVPQVLGPILDRIAQSERTLLDELYSVDDNPLIDPVAGIHHGGNFHGDQVSLEMDTLRLALVKLCMLGERQLNLLLNDKVNQRFPPFLNIETLGLTLGMQGMQFAATSTTAECQALSTSLYIHSIPNNNDNQDIVSMGTNAALATARVIGHAERVLSILAIAVAQAVDIVGVAGKLSPAGAALHARIRTATAPIRTGSDPAAAIDATHAVLFGPKNDTEATPTPATARKA
ncbi:MAG: aromatic amino acid lyase [Flavobacteriales bacterium]|nr:aromatic amino acid lyase [Flavobacteriales bacterium]